MSSVDWSQFRRERIAHLPTPLEPMPRLTLTLAGPQLYVKRDDCTGLATGGNKIRKLEFLVAEALAQGADTLITAGGVQSNHARQTAAVAARFGLHCELVLTRTVAWADPAYERTGNLLYDRLLGATVHLLAADADRDAVMAERAAALTIRGRRPYVIPVGGSNAIGALGYVVCADELYQQVQRSGIEVDALVVASGSGGTLAGLVVGRAVCGAAFPIIAISDGDPAEELQVKSRDIANDAARLLAVDVEWRDVEILDDYVGTGYGLPTDEMVEAVQLVARTEGLFLDPVYTGKAMAGLIDLIRTQRFGTRDTVVFLHTGGTAALSAYPSLFAESG